MINSLRFMGTPIYAPPVISDDPPRILFWSVPEEVRTTFDGLPGTHAFVEGDAQVHETDFDLLVTFERTPVLASNWHVLGFGLEAADTRVDEHVELTRIVASHARHAYVAGGEVASSLRPFIERTILSGTTLPPRLVWQAERVRWINGSEYRTPVDGGTFDGTVIPLVHVGAEEYVYAFIAQHREGQYLWALPEHTTDHREWIVYVLEALHRVDPEKFPGSPDWQGGTDWATAALAQAHVALESEQADRERLITEADERVRAARDHVAAERASAAAGPWRLLTEQGDELVRAVRDAFDALGFHAIEFDQTHRDKRGRLLEDLRVTDPTAPDWEALVEVKGYSKGAKVTELAQVVGAPTNYYILEKGREPESVWHVVNVQKDRDPSLRDPIRFTDTDLQPLTEAHGAIIDTRDLFRAWRAVEDGTAEPAAVRASLREAVTRWIWTSSTEVAD